MNRSAKQTNRTRNTSRVHAICLFRTAIHFPWTEKKKDTNSLITPYRGEEEDDLQLVRIFD